MGIERMIKSDTVGMKKDISNPFKRHYIKSEELNDQAKLTHGTPIEFSFVQEKLSQYNQGLLTFEEVGSALADRRIYGAIDGTLDHISYVGYDYKNQEWIEVDLCR